MPDFIEELAPLAQKHGKAADVLPSLILAQGILESDSGKSELATNAHNYFGIKKGSGWSGPVYEKVTKEWSKERGTYEITGVFRKYASMEACVTDLMDKYTNGVPWESFNRYAAILGIKEYAAAARSLLEAGYATDPVYPEKLMSVIVEYDLTKYDEKEVVQVASANNFLIALDDGHGEHTAGKRTPYIASLGRQVKENEFNRPTVNYLEAELKRCGFRTLQLAPTNQDTPLVTRTNAANRAKADILVSIHFNAMGNTFGYSSAKGFSAHIQEGLSNSSKAYKLAQLMVAELAKGTVQTNRGIVKQNLHMTRASAMPAVLVECGFMDDPSEALLMVNKSFQQEVAKELAQAICRYFGVSYMGDKGTAKPASNDPKYYRVRKSWADAKSQIGAFESFAIAKGAADEAGLNVYDAKGTLVHTGKKTVKKPKEEAKVPEPEYRAVSGSFVEDWEWVQEKGLLDGSRPGENLTREQAAAVVHRLYDVIMEDSKK